MWSRQVADQPRTAAASDGGDSRRLTPESTAPHLPTLHSFVLRRTTCREDAEDLLVEVLLRASADLERRGRESLEVAELLRYAHQVVASEEQDNPLLSAGLQPGGVVPDVLPESMQRTIAGLPPLQRYVLAMRLGDGLSMDQISQILGQPPERLLDPMAEAVEALLPDRQHGPVDPMVLCGYTEAVLAGRGRAPSALPEAAQQVVRTIASTRVPVTPSEAEEQRVWHRYEQEREEFLPGTTLPTLPAWARAMLLSLLLLLGLVAVSLWWLSRPADEPRRMAAEAPTAQPVQGRTPPSTGSSPTRRPELPQIVSGATGRLFALVHGSGDTTALQLVNLSERQPDGVPATRSLLAVPGGTLPFALSPSGLRVAYGRGDGVWMQDVDGGYTRLVATLGAVRKPIEGNNVAERCEGSRAGALAWRPDSSAIAAVWEKHCGGPAPEVHLLSTAGWPTKMLVRLELQEEVSALSWSPDGRYLLITSNYGLALLDTARGNALNRFPPQWTSAEWSPEAERPMLLFRSTAGGRRPQWGTVEPGAEKPVMLSSGDFAWWTPDGSVLLVQREESGRYSVFSTGPGVGRPTLLAQRRFAGTETPRFARLSPDARYAAYATLDSVYVLDYEQGTQQKLPLNGERPADLVWLPPAEEIAPLGAPDYRAAGTLLYMEPVSSLARQDRRLVAVNAATGRGIELVRGHGLTYSQSPLGDAVAYSAGCRITVLDLATGRSRQATCKSGSEVPSVSWAPDGQSLVYVSQRLPQRSRGIRSAPAGPTISVTDVWQLDLLTGGQTRLVSGSSLFSPRSVSYSPSARWLLVTDGERWRLMAADGSSLIGLPAAARQYSWAPDPTSDRLLAVGPGAEVLQVGPDGTRSLWKLRLKSAVAEGNWLAPHRFALIAGEAGHLVLGDDSTRRQTELTMRGAAPSPGLGSPGPRFSSGLTASPDLRWLAFGGEDGLFTFEPAAGGGQSRMLVAADFGVVSPSWITYSGPVRPAGLDQPFPEGQPSRRTAVVLMEADGGRYRPLWLYDRLTGVRRRLADASGFDVSPDSRRVVYTDSVDVWQIDLATGEEAPLTDLGAAGLPTDTFLHSPKWSYSGRYISYVADLSPNRGAGQPALSQVRVIDLETGVDRAYQEVDSGKPIGRIVGTSWSGDDTSILLDTGSLAVRLPIAPAGRQHELGDSVVYSDAGEAALSPQPRDESVLYRQYSAGEMGGELLVRAPDGVTHSLSQNATSEIWAPDGASIYYFEDGSLWQSSRDGEYRRLAVGRVPYGLTASRPVWSGVDHLSYTSGRLVLDLDLATGRSEPEVTWPTEVEGVRWVTAPVLSGPSAP